MSEAVAVESKFGIQRIYLKDLSVEVPGSPGVYLEMGVMPHMNVELGVSSEKIGDNLYEVVLKTTLTATKSATEASVLFLVEVKYGGVFEVVAEQGVVQSVLNETCPQMLLPYVRAQISDVLSRGTLPQFLLPEVSFRQMAEQSRVQGEGGVMTAGPLTLQ